VLGADALSGKTDFTTYTTSTNCTIDDLNSFTTTASSKYIFRNTILTSGATYKFRLAGTLTGTGTVKITDASLATIYNSGGSGTFDVTSYAVAVGTPIYIVISGGQGTFDMTSLSAELVTLPSITANIGSKSATTSSVSCVSGTFTKFVLNFQATASEIGQPLKLYVNQADTVFVDDVSLKQAYDAIIMSTVKTSASVSNAGIFGHRSSSTSNLYIIGNTSQQLRASVGDVAGTIVTDQGAPTFNDGLFHHVAATINRTGNITRYLDNVAGTGASITALGQIGTGDALYVGDLAGTTNFWNGLIGSCQFIVFQNGLPSDGGASIIADAYNRFRSGKGFQRAYSGGTVVAWYDWRSRGTDLSGQGNHLTPTASPPIVKIP
jgi:hypothetical protein